MIIIHSTERVITMRRIDSRTIDLTTTSEVLAKERFDTLLDQGEGIPTAARNALHFFLAQGHRFSSEFIDYLSEGCLTGNRNSDLPLTTPKGRDLGLSYPRPW